MTTSVRWTQGIEAVHCGIDTGEMQDKETSKHMERSNPHTFTADSMDLLSRSKNKKSGGVHYVHST